MNYFAVGRVIFSLSTIRIHHYLFETRQTKQKRNYVYHDNELLVRMLQVGGYIDI